ncbi:hypothetical protein [Endozoicomonas sp. SCSIO W0465]|uniref:hypothetical protein n=1 Tax=Endozoicomonas sp. SCSIO W0465 TaxID=2918516 RepID=UPI002074FD14|nr:hypothetical protein [Endozoicomonas sp. SCSIO W0465]USE36391.1 hypothetical protein MJO57_30955 [Endozoicomonas sp. SCSIO W0465]
MLANIVEKWCLRGWYKNQKIPDLCGGAEQLQNNNVPFHQYADFPGERYCSSLILIFRLGSFSTICWAIE